jgi:hypothetical protein
MPCRKDSIAFRRNAPREKVDVHRLDDDPLRAVEVQLDAAALVHSAAPAVFVADADVDAIEPVGEAAQGEAHAPLDVVEQRWRESGPTGSNREVHGESPSAPWIRSILDENRWIYCRDNSMQPNYSGRRWSG